MNNENTVYIAGKITGDPAYKEKFAAARRALEIEGFIVLDPSILPSSGFEYAAYIHISTAMMDECAQVCFLTDWKESNGAMYEHGRATAQNKTIFYYEDWERRRTLPPRGVTVHKTGVDHCACIPEVEDGEG